ncbi:hypothetical protein F3Y22_tig00110677pilonHSYRG00083 [Hibiscus syriacus]|uniref:Uncharacterized protein n=1 Tax=Hibiscus syriacus TaxID=106335 RepID=A0A6A2ZXW0_HIBSY|nr:hypothetical protein F3Y22_tig00110677pilonHSYRG00083 [Hibiscus syriacus]
MAETSKSQPNPDLILDPISLFLSQNSSPTSPFPLRLTTESPVMERGPRYRAYAELRETKLRMMQREKEDVEIKQTPTKKQVKFSSSVGISLKGSSSLVAQSVPDFPATLRKENRRPPGVELTPPLTGKNWWKENEAANAINGENRGGKTNGRGVGGASNTILRYRQL